MNWEKILKEKKKISLGTITPYWRGYAEHKFWGDENNLHNDFIGIFNWIDKLSDEDKQDEGIQEDIAYMVKMAEKYGAIFDKILKEYK
tara:strand:- start:26421 stop:26684 length:264 start_codon:yes stop_codon:yes gene_type:complete